MKLELLAELLNPTTSTAEYNGKLKYGGWRNTRKSLGNGTQAAAKPDPNDPHMAKKHNTNPYKRENPEPGQRVDDGFHIFIEYLIEHKLFDNPHFPKVYNIKTITDKAGQHIHTYTMEKLIKTENISRQEMEAFLERSINPAKLQMLGEGRDDDMWVAVMMERANTIMHEVFDYGKRDCIIDETLEAAFLQLREIGHELGKDSDLHPGNYMWRRSSLGLTLIINDPFF